jgi:hypothetical protein
VLFKCVAALTATAGLLSFAWAEAEKAEDGWVSLFDGKTLAGWKQLNGKATYVVEDGCLVGTTAEGSRNSFLCSEKDYGDFELEFDVRVDSRLNSGVQIRSESKPDYRDGRVHGYQVEIAVNGNAGRVYDEARRGKFLDPDLTDAEKKGAFKKDEWNHYRVVCQGDSIRTWVNGIQIVELNDGMTKKGFLGLQVHSFKGEPPARVWWKNLRLKELGATEPAAAAPMGGG